MKELFVFYGIEVVLVGDFGLLEFEEIGNDFCSNVVIKVVVVVQVIGFVVFVDDFGIVVDVFDGVFGIYSVCWVGFFKDFNVVMVQIECLLQECGVIMLVKCIVYFVLVFCVVWFDDYCEEVEVCVDGMLVWLLCGIVGFGYDFMFLFDGYVCIFGEMSSIEKYGLLLFGFGLLYCVCVFVKLVEICFEL